MEYLYINPSNTLHHFQQKNMKFYFENKLIFLRFLCIVLLLFQITSCKHDPIIPESPAMSFQHDIQPIITANCTEPGCHGNTNSRKFPLITYDDIMKNSEIIPGNAQKSKLYLTITAKKGNQIMPPSSKHPLSDQQITTIYLWIMQGAKNN